MRNLRQREDLPKYLRNLDPNSAHYDGKSRIMKDNPNPDLPESQQLFKGDNFVKFSGDALQVMQQEAFMIQANEALKVQKQQSGSRDQPEQQGEQGPLGAGAEINAVAMPSQIEILRKEHADRKEKMKSTNMQKLYAKYGGEDHVQVPDELKAAGVEAEFFPKQHQIG